MNVSAISSNNTNFGAKFTSNRVYKEIFNNPFYIKNNTEVTDRLFKQLEETGKNHQLDIQAIVDFTHLNLHETGIKVINLANGKERVYTDSVNKPFWDKILTQMLADKTFFEA